LRALMPVLMSLACGAPAAMAQAPGGAAAPVCIYQDKTYSAGAAICPQARLMLTCSQENDKLVWKIVSDPELANRCVAASVTAERPARRRHVVRYRAPRAAARAAAANVTPPTARCFAFNGKRYCE
jgi:hypothetical protein